jgi:hypothetical protein
LGPARLTGGAYGRRDAAFRVGMIIRFVAADGAWRSGR